MKKITLIAISTALLLVTLTAAWYVFVRGEKPAVTDFASCAAAGNPIMESYPEQCAANGQTYTNPDQIASPAPQSDSQDPTAAWLSYTSSADTYTVRIPDGWELLNIDGTENLYGGKLAPLTHTPGTPASVRTTEGGWDGSSPFALYVPGAYYDQIVRQGDKTGMVTTSQGLTAEKYLFVETSQEDYIENYGYGSVVYNYYFGADGKYIQVQHVVKEGEEDQSAFVEQMLQTLLIN